MKKPKVDKLITGLGATGTGLMGLAAEKCFAAGWFYTGCFVAASGALAGTMIPLNIPDYRGKLKTREAKEKIKEKKRYDFRPLNFELDGKVKDAKEESYRNLDFWKKRKRKRLTIEDEEGKLEAVYYGKENLENEEIEALLFKKPLKDLRLLDYEKI